jgi:hypothetical protein
MIFYTLILRQLNSYDHPYKDTAGAPNTLVRESTPTELGNRRTRGTKRFTTPKKRSISSLSTPFSRLPERSPKKSFWIWMLPMIRFMDTRKGGSSMAITIAIAIYPCTFSVGISFCWPNSGLRIWIPDTNRFPTWCR